MKIDNILRYGKLENRLRYRKQNIDLDLENRKQIEI